MYFRYFIRHRNPENVSVINIPHTVKNKKIKKTASFIFIFLCSSYFSVSGESPLQLCHFSHNLSVFFMCHYLSPLTHVFLLAVSFLHGSSIYVCLTKHTKKKKKKKKINNTLSPVYFLSRSSDQKYWSWERSCCQPSAHRLESLEESSIWGGEFQPQLLPTLLQL